MSTIYKETEYQMVDLGDKKILLSIEEQFDIGTQTDLDGDLSGTNVVIYAQDLLLSKKLKAKSIGIYAHNIATVSQSSPIGVGNQSRAVVFAADEDLLVHEGKQLELFDFNNERYLSLTSVTSHQGSLVLEEKIANGIKNIDLTRFMFAHPTQCSMLLQKAQLLYRKGDPVVNKKDLDQAIVLFTRLRNLLRVFHDLKLSDNLQDNPPLAKLYAEHEASIGAVDSIATFKNIYNTANGLLGQIKKGSDYYGNSYNYVPLASKEFYQKILEEQIENFRYIETDYFQFIDTERKEEDRLNNLRNAISHLNYVSTKANNDIDSLKARALSAEAEIKNLENQFQAKRDLVKQRLEEFKEKLESSFNLDIKSLLSSLTTLAFLKESPVIGLLNAGADIGYNIYEGATTVKNDEGITVQKDYLINKVEVFQGDISLKNLDEQSKKLDDGSIKLDDLGANKLIVEEQKLNKFLSDFYVKFPDTTKMLQNAFQDYTNLVLARNNKVVYYNAIITLIIKNHNIIKDCDQKKGLLDEENLRLYKPSLPAFTDLMGSLYTSSQAQVMESLYLNERAFRFWSLSDQKPVTEIFADNQLSAINTSILKEAQSSILNFYEHVIEDRRKIPPQYFPTKAGGTGSIYWELSEDEVNTLKAGFDGKYAVLFKIPPAMIDTNKTANPFAGYADIRLTNVYVWIDGIKTSDNELTLTLTHTGNETIISEDNSEFSFKHNSKNIPFKYQLKSKDILEGGNIGNDGKDITYALVGPFTWWNITIEANYNNNLDFSCVSKVQLEFQGNNYPFNQ